MITYLSPSSIGLWRKSNEQFYCQYLASCLVPRSAQTLPMAMGSEFDRLIKNWLQSSLGLPVCDYTSQVALEHRKTVRLGGEFLLGEYLPWARKLLEYIGDSKVEFYDEGISRTVNGCPLFGKPDLVVMGKLVTDWKVNGFFSHASPKGGYTLLNGDTHPKSHLMMHESGCLMNISRTIDDINADWGRQLCIYDWLVDCPGMLLGLDQLACDTRKTGPNPSVRTALYRGTISPGFRESLREEVGQIWDVINSDHVLRDYSKGESQDRCAALDKAGELASVL